MNAVRTWLSGREDLAVTILLDSKGHLYFTYKTDTKLKIYLRLLTLL